MPEHLMIYLLAGGFSLFLLTVAYLTWSIGRRVVQAYRQQVLDATSVRLSEMFIFMDARQLTRLSAGIALVVILAVALVTANPLLVLGAAIVCLAGPRLAHRRLRIRRRKLLVRQLPDTLDALVGGLRSGLSLQQSLGLLAEQLPVPSRQEFGLVVRELRMGLAVDDVLQDLEKRVDTQEYTMFTTCMRIAREVGGNLTESLERLSETMRRKLTMEDKIDALTSQGKLQGIIVGALPLMLMWVLSEMEPEAMAPLFSTWYGYCTLAVIALLELAGYVLIRKIVNIDV
jgi:tight adherence protein B